jgi:hypothetical protein
MPWDVERLTPAELDEYVRRLKAEFDAQRTERARRKRAAKR